jgi:DnaJ like chaperone protein
MAWLGKVVGGLVGFSLGGPLGMIAGIAFGNIFDNADSAGNGGKQTRYREFNGGQRHPYMSNSEQKNMTFFVAVFSLLARLAQADGSVTPEEKNTLNTFMVKDLQLDPQSRNAALRVFNAALNGAGTADQFSQQFYDSFKTDQALLQLVVDILFRMAVSDGAMSSKESNLIKNVCKIFKFSESYFDAMSRKYSVASSSEGAYTVLGITSNASDDDVKKAYRKMSIEYHPDTVHAKGLPEEFEKVATKKFREIQEAYDTIKKDRHIK